jgi:hypothetical protein
MTAIEGTNYQYVRYFLSYDQKGQTSIIPQLIFQANIAQDKAKYSDYLHREVQRILEKSVETSSTKYICITGINFSVFRLRNTGAGELIPGYEDLYNSHNRAIFTCASGQNTCVLECIYIATDIEKYRSLKGNLKQIMSKIKVIYHTLFNAKLPNNFEGVDVFSTLKLAADKFNLTFTIFTREPKAQDNEKPPYVLFETIESSSSESTNINLLLCYNKQKQHTMFIKDLEALTNFHVCPKCKNYLLSKSSFEDHKERFDKHVKNCDGKFHSRINLKFHSRGYLQKEDKQNMNSQKTIFAMILRL